MNKLVAVLTAATAMFCGTVTLCTGQSTIPRSQADFPVGVWIRSRAQLVINNHYSQDLSGGGTLVLPRRAEDSTPKALRALYVAYINDGDQVKVVVRGVVNTSVSLVPTPHVEKVVDEAVHYTWLGRFDGAEYPVTGDPESDSRSYTKIRNRTYRMSVKLHGQEVCNAEVTFSGNKCTMVTKDGTVEYQAVNMRGKDGAELLISAAKNGDIDYLKALLAYHANVKARDSKGITALMYAATLGRADCVSALIDGKSDVNACDNNGRTPLMWAAIGSSSDCVAALIAAGAKVTMRTPSGDTALTFAKDNSAIVEALKAAGAKD